MQWAAHLLRAPFGVQRIRDRQRIGVRLEDLIEGGAALIQLADAREIQFGDLARRVLPALHRVLQLRNGDFIQLERVRRARRRGGPCTFGAPRQ